LPELAVCESPPRRDLLRLLRASAAAIWPAQRVIAEDVLGADAKIDWVALEPGGRACAVLVGERGEDLELIARGLAQRSWLAPRLRDWLQLAPRIGLRPEAGARALLFCPEFRGEALAAAGAVGSEVLSLASYRCVRDADGVSVLIEPIRDAGGAVDALEARQQQPAEPFRTGLSDLDLGVTPDERREFERLASPRGAAG
jgi:hypothetical protein